MRLSFRFGILAAALLAPSIAAADSGFYLGADWGRAKASQPLLFSAESVEGNITYVTQPSYEQTSSAHRFNLGFSFDQYFGLELAYADLGSRTAFAQETSRPSGVTCGLLCDNSFDNAPRETERGASLSAVGSYPLPFGFSVFARYGFFWQQVSYDSGVTGTNSPIYGNNDLPQNFHLTQHGTTDTLGFGVRWGFADHWALRASWDDYRDLQDISAQRFDVRVTSLGVEYHF